jgi:molecular chaperone GrpE
MIPTTEVPENYVVEELLRGYKLRDRLLRPAMVLVAQNPGR